MPDYPSREDLLGMARAFQPACVLAAAADWNIFTPLSANPMTAPALAAALGCDQRALTVLLDALVGMRLLEKQGGQYRVPATLAPWLSETSSESILPMIHHQANCLRRWAQLSRVVRTGTPADLLPSIRGEAGDCLSFIGAMHNVSGPVAERIVAEINPSGFHHLLDVGGASGTWTLAFLRHAPQARATLFDLPEVIPLAQARFRQAGYSDRVRCVPGDFYNDELPGGVDLVWLSAIIHQNSRPQNRQLFEKIHRALGAGGALLIRDVVMDDSHTDPPAGAMFAVNMLVATQGGGTYSLPEYREDLEAAGFADIRVVRRDPWMDSIVLAKRL